VQKHNCDTGGSNAWPSDSSCLRIAQAVYWGSSMIGGKGTSV